MFRKWQTDAQQVKSGTEILIYSYYFLRKYSTCIKLLFYRKHDFDICENVSICLKLNLTCKLWILQTNTKG